LGSDRPGLVLLILIGTDRKFDFRQGFTGKQQGQTLFGFRRPTAATIDVFGERGIQSRRKLGASLRMSHRVLHKIAVSERVMLVWPEDQKKQ
jgi:hypothetical protein